MSDEPADLTLQILRDIRTELRESNQQQRVFQEQQRVFQDHSMARFEVIETALRDLAQQLVILVRGVKVAIAARGRIDEKIDDHERRLSELERSRPNP